MFTVKLDMQTKEDGNSVVDKTNVVDHVIYIFEN